MSPVLNMEFCSRRSGQQLKTAGKQQQFSHEEQSRDATKQIGEFLSERTRLDTMPDKQAACSV